MMSKPRQSRFRDGSLWGTVWTPHEPRSMATVRRSACENARSSWLGYGVVVRIPKGYEKSGSGLLRNRL